MKFAAVSLVEKWLEELHDRRRCIEISFRNRKLQLEQCLALALLATDLRDLEEILNDRRTALNSTGDHLGDSLASAKLLIHELKKLQIEAKVEFCPIKIHRTFNFQFLKLLIENFRFLGFPRQSNKSYKINRKISVFRTFCGRAGNETILRNS